MELNTRVEKLEESLEELKKEMKQLTEDNIRTDEKYKTMVSMMTTLQAGFNDLSKTVNDALIRLALNDQTTNRTAAWVENITIPKIITTVVGVIAIISFWKST